MSDDEKLPSGDGLTDEQIDAIASPYLTLGDGDTEHDTVDWRGFARAILAAPRQPGWFDIPASRVEKFRQDFLEVRALYTHPSPEAESDKRDAERYRWLRDTHPADGGLWVAMGVPGVGISCWRNEELDAQIDAAMSREQSGGQK